MLFSILTGCSRCPDTDLGPVDLLGYRAMVETKEGLVRRFDDESLPFFRIPAGSDPVAASFIVDGDEVKLPIEKIERRGSWLIVRTGRPESQPGRGEIRLNGLAWPAEWTRRDAEPAQHELLFRRAGEIRKSGDSSAYAEALLAAARAAEEARVVTEATRMWRAAAYAHLYGRRFREMEPLLARAEALDRRIGNHSGLVRAAHYRGYLLTQQGRLRAAREVLEDGLSRAEDYGLDRDRADLKLSLASLLQDLGRHEAGLALREEVADRFLNGSSTDRIVFLMDLGWAELRAIEAGAVSLPFDRPRQHFVEALELCRSTGDSQREPNALANLLWLAHLEGDDRASATWLSELETHPQVDAGYARLFLPFARAHVRLRQGRLEEAKESFERLAALARLEGGSSDYLWRATYGLGQVHLQLGERQEAAARFRHAIEQLDRLAQETDLTASRALFFHDRRALLADAESLAQEEGRLFEALSFADRARIHVLRSLQAKVRIERLDPGARQIWQDRVAEYLSLRDAYQEKTRELEIVERTRVAALESETARLRIRMKERFDELYAHLDHVSPAPSVELDVERMTGALGSDALVIFSRLGDQTGSYFASPSIEHRSGGSLRVWSDRLGRTPHLYVVAGGGVAVKDVMAELDADLLHRTSISFLTHAGALLEPSDPATGPPVVVADPDGTLPYAAREGAWVAEHLGSAPIERPPFTRAQIVERLRGAAVFHFSGHGVLAASQPWDAHLVLARGETLSLEDLLVARPRIGLVVLNGCETGAMSELSATEVIGLVHAFAAGGARAVLATTAEISDADAFRFIRRFYERGGAAAPIEAYRRAALDAHADGDPSWRTFYVLGRR